jgi:four helix bundle protein
LKNEKVMINSKTSDLKKRTKVFAHDCVKLALELKKDELGSHVKKQLIRCSTSVAANYRATSFAQSKDAFIAKLSIVLEEADESLFWIEFIEEEKLIQPLRLNQLKQEASELTAIFAKSRLTARENKN